MLDPGEEREKIEGMAGGEKREARGETRPLLVKALSSGNTKLSRKRAHGTLSGKKGESRRRLGALMRPGTTRGRTRGLSRRKNSLD